VLPAIKSQLQLSGQHPDIKSIKVEQVVHPWLHQFSCAIWSVAWVLGSVSICEHDRWSLLQREYVLDPWEI